MSIAMNGKGFEVQLMAASVKLVRAMDNDGFDPISGFDKDDIVRFLIDLSDLGNDEQISRVKAVLRRNGFIEEANSFVV